MNTTREQQLSNITRQVTAIAAQLDTLLSNFRCGCDGNCDVCEGLVRLSVDADQFGHVCRANLNADANRYENAA